MERKKEGAKQSLNSKYATNRKIRNGIYSATKKIKAPGDASFPLMILRNRGPVGMASIIRMSGDIDTFTMLINKHFSKRVIKRISTRTQGQSNNSFWFLYRRAIITGTLARRVISQNICGETNLKLNQAISKFFPNNFCSEAMQYGIENEKKGMDQFLKIFKNEHIGVKVKNTGVILYERVPYIAGSPDGIVSCECHTESFLVEIKCPYRLKSVGISGWKILEYLDARQKLKKNHTYMNQVNLYQGITGIKTAYFVVYAKDDVIIDTIDFDESFFRYQIYNMENYYKNHYLPTVLGKNI